MKKIYRILLWVVGLMPMMAFAISTFDQLIIQVKVWITAVFPVLIALAALIFVWQVVMYITSAGDEEKRKAAQKGMLYGLVGLFVLVSFWGIVQLIAGSFSLPTTVPSVPGLPN